MLTSTLKTFCFGRRRMDNSQEGIYGMIKGLSLYNDHPDLEQRLRQTVDRFERHFAMPAPLESEFETLINQELLRRPSHFMENAFTFRREQGIDLDLENALNKNQLACKLWIVETLKQHFPIPPEKVLVLGGWVGVLSALLIERLGWHKSVQFKTLDLDPAASARARLLLKSYLHDGTASVEVGDMFKQAYDEPNTLLVNTSCEHIQPFSSWWNLLPEGQLVLLQSNDYYDEPTHVNCVPDLAAFQAQAPLRETIFAGTLTTKNYNRFMLIGRK